MRFIMPVILIGIAIALFFVFTNPFYNQLSELRSEAASYNTALDNSVRLEQQRDKLVKQENDIDPNNIVKLEKLLPDNVNNIRLILEIQKIAEPYGMSLKDVKYNVAEATETEETTVQRGRNVTPVSNEDYGVFDLEFSVSGTYDNFIGFIEALEKNLRIVDVSSIEFSSTNLAAGGTSVGGAEIKTNSPEVYKYNFKIKTYWLKK
jgi:Tfp pilus assembly protein PilO